MKTPTADEARDVQWERDFRGVMNSEEGRRFIFGLIYGKCRLETPSPQEAEAAIRHKGRQDVAFDLRRIARWSFPELWRAMQLEGVAADCERDMKVRDEKEHHREVRT